MHPARPAVLDGLLHPCTCEAVCWLTLPSAPTSPAPSAATSSFAQCCARRSPIAQTTARSNLVFIQTG